MENKDVKAAEAKAEEKEIAKEEKPADPADDAVGVESPDGVAANPPEKETPKIDFNHIMEVMRGSNSSINTNVILNLIDSIGNGVANNSPAVVEFIGKQINVPLPQACKNSMIFVLNSMLASLWSVFGDKFTALYEANKAKEKEELADKPEDKPKAEKAN